MDLQHIQRTLAKSSYDEIADKLSDCTDDELLALVDVRSRRIGDTAATLLATHEQYDAIIDAILSSHIRTAEGKIRATNILQYKGMYLPRAEEAYLALLSDRSFGVATNALLGLVFSQKKSHIPAIKQAMAKSKPGSEIREQYELAIKALANESPSLYSSGFRDANNVWPPDKNRVKN